MSLLFFHGVSPAPETVPNDSYFTPVIKADLG